MLKVESDARGAVVHMDDATLPETVTRDGVQHGVVVSVRIDAHIVSVRRAEVEAGAGDAVRVAIGGEAMDGAVGPIGMPLALLDGAVGRFLAEDEGECPNDLPPVVGWGADVAVATHDVPSHDVRMRVLIVPLRGVAVGGHEAACCLKEI